MLGVGRTGSCDMRFSSVLIELAATPAYLLAIFCLLTFVFHLAFVWVWPIGDLAWKRIDYVWLGAATLGLMGASGHADRYISGELAANLEEPRTARAYRDIRFIIEKAAEPTSSICSERTRSEFSPPYYDEIVREQQRQCSYFRVLADAIPDEVAAPFPTLDVLGFTDYAGSTDHESWYIAQTRKSAKEYEAQRELYVQRKRSAEVSDFEASITLLGPVLLCFALALRITKVSGEVRNAKRKSSQKP